MEKNGKNGGGGGGKKEKTDGNSGHYNIASSWLPERRPLERRTLMPKVIPFNVFKNPRFSPPNQISWPWTTKLLGVTLSSDLSWMLQAGRP